MSEKTTREQREMQPRDAEYWAPLVHSFRVENPPEGVSAAGVEGRRAVGPLQGFGKMWQKTYSMRLEGVQATPEEVVEAWREGFPEISGFGKGFRVPPGGLTPGAVALLGGGLTGVMVLYSDSESFAYMTPEGHPVSGWITFSAHSDEDGTTVARIRLIIRANDPFWELFMSLGLHRGEDMQWRGTLRNLATRFGASGRVETHLVCVDSKRQWRNVRNIRYNALLHTAIRLLRRER